MSHDSNNIMVILSSPSGAGKTTITKKIQQKYQSFKISVSHTTRKPRPNEVGGVDYHFVSHEKFKKFISEGKFYEYAKIFDNYYGTSKEIVDEMIKKNDIIFDIDWQGTQQLKKIKNLSLVTFFILPPNIQTLKKRLLNRHKGQEELIEKRMNKFSEEGNHWNEYNYVFINDDLDICYEKILNVIRSEKNGVKQ
jgi:guanylate kinase